MTSNAKTRRDDWETGYRHLVAYDKAHGDCNVPISYKVPRASGRTSPRATGNVPGTTLRPEDVGAHAAIYMYRRLWQALNSHDLAAAVSGIFDEMAQQYYSNTGKKVATTWREGTAGE